MIKMEEFSKNGRKLRPRKNFGGEESRPAASSRPGRPGRTYGAGKPAGDRRQSAYGKPGYGRTEKPEYRKSEKPGFRRSERSGSDRPGFSKPGFGRSDRPSRFGKPSGRFDRRGNSPRFSRESDEGINRMISRKPLVEDNKFSDSETFHGNFEEEVRLNKFIANSGVCSRREADTFIQAGVVTVNGEVVTELGTKVNVLKDEVKFNGERLKGEEKVYIVMNKPSGYVTTASDPHADKTVIELLKGCKYRVYPVGRLDKNTTGVLMFTNDGEIAERLTHPSYDKKKIYQVIVDHEVSQEDHDKILAGITLNDGPVAADELEFIDASDHRKLGIEIHSGKNRIVRRIFESLGYNVKALDRVYFAGLTKKGLKKGEWRFLTEGEVNILKMGAYA